MKIELTDDEAASIQQALREKADADDERAKEFPDMPRMAFTFEEQARKQRALADKIENK
jgi:hypothetical protein